MMRIFTMNFAKKLHRMLKKRSKHKTKIIKHPFSKGSRAYSAVVIFAFLSLMPLTGFGQVKAAFTLTNMKDTVGCVPLSVKFSNNSTNGVSYNWDFGDGNKSNLESPSNVYLKPGYFSVKLVATGSNGAKDSVVYKSFIHVVDSPVTNFYALNTIVCPGFQISFKNTSVSANNYIWDFGDGGISTLANPSHAYKDSGYHTVRLIAKNIYG